MKTSKYGDAKALVASCVLLAVGLSASGCGIIKPTRERRGEVVHSGFLGDYSQLAPQEGSAAQEIYVDPNAAWAKYNAIYIESVSIWVDPQTKPIDPEDQQRLTDMLYKAMYDKLGEKFTLVTHPGPGVIKLRMAITQAKGAKVALNAITTVIPQLRLVSTLGGVSADTALLVGSASAEMEATDSVTNVRLAAAIDARAGTKGVLRAFSKWADVEAIDKYWAEHVRDFFVKQGVQQKG